jgi:hypothetical protein
VRALFLASFALAAVPGASAAPHSDPINAFACANIQLLPKGEYLKASDLLTETKKAETDPFGPLHQFANVAVSFVTARASTPQASPATADKSDLRKLRRAELRDALSEIVARARRTSIVILNEEHQSPRDRAFALQVARVLRPLGYSILAAEAFSSSADPAEMERKTTVISEDGYPRLETGLYTRDPVFGGFVRQSLALGYRPVAYEFVAPKGAPQATDPVAQRDQGEADNLIREILFKSPTAKVLIYVGYWHAAERPIYGNSWLAARLKKMTGINPLTIDQTTLSPSATGAKDRALYSALKSRLGTRSAVPMIGDKPLTFGDLGHAVDLQVAHPPVRLVRGRPDWLFAMGRSALQVPAKLRPRTGRVLVQAYLASESPDAVPVDQVVVTAGQKPPPLLVPAGRLRFAVRTGYRPGDCAAAPK